jgi:hypothetical protein
MDNKEPENKNNINTIDNQPKKRGRPKKYNFDSSNRREYDQKRYEVNKEHMKVKFKDNYIQNKDEIKEKSKDLQNRYRNGYKLLIDLFKNGEINTSVEKFEKIKKIIIE